MRKIACAALALSLAGCAVQPSAVPTPLNPADAATALSVGGPVRMSVASRAGGAGQDPLVTMTLTHQDGRTLVFTEANHAPYDVMAQAAGGPLAQVMGFQGEERPTLYARQSQTGAPFICSPEGPAMLGIHTAANGEMTIVGLKSGFEFEPRDGGAYDPIPYSPDHVCARLKFRR